MTLRKSGPYFGPVQPIVVPRPPLSFSTASLFRRDLTLVCSALTKVTELVRNNPPWYIQIWNWKPIYSKRILTASRNYNVYPTTASLKSPLCDSWWLWTQKGHVNNQTRFPNYETYKSSCWGWLFNFRIRSLPTLHAWNGPREETARWSFSILCFPRM